MAGLQTLLDAVRNAGARQPVLAGGLDFANDLGAHGTAWMDHAPDDPLDQEAASFHNHMGKTCDNPSCWNSEIAPVAAHVPVVTGEFAEDDFDESTCSTTTPSTFDATYMKWADAAGVSYLAWGWIVETSAELASEGCSAFTLIDDYSHYSPAEPNGTAVHTHLLALAQAASGHREPPVTLAAFHAAVGPGNRSVRFALRSPETAHLTLAAATRHTPRPTSLSTVHGTLKRGRSTTVALELSRSARKLLVRRRSLAVRVTMTLTSPGHRRTVLHRTVTLHRRV